MSKKYISLLWALSLATVVAGGLLLVAPSTAQAQPVDASETEALEAADQAAADADVLAEDAALEAEDAAILDADAAGEEAVEIDVAEADAAAANAAPGAAAGEVSMSPWMIALMLLAMFVLPVLFGNFVAKKLRMPDHGWKITVVVGALLAAAIILTFGQFKFGPDLAGGITLIFELADTSEVVVQDEDEPPEDVEVAAPGRRQINMGELISALKERVDPTGTREVTIREYGKAIEVIIPDTGEADLKYVKRRITDLGQLEFRITADQSQPNDRPIIDQALLIPPSQKDLFIEGQKRAEWVGYAEAEFGPFDQLDNRVVKRMAGDTPEALVLIDSYNVTGEYLESASKGFGDNGGPAVNFVFDSNGSRRFAAFTSENRPNQATGAVRYLGIILDKRLISAPSIRETIRGRGQISGGAMNEEEVDYIISILNAGSLPASLNKEPISEQSISPTLGAVTIEKGKFAISLSLAVVLVFMLLYYRVAGVIACMALAANLIFVLAVMVLIKAAFTLPGLAGLVLTIGMSVDANVLIFERIREELGHGAALRMAIRNGFSRASTTIIDASLTTLIAGVVLYAIGTDQIKGFAVTLILGILMSMFTGIFCSRLVFDIIERRGWIKKLSMTRLLGETNINFLSMRKVCAGLSVILIAAGLYGVVSRGSSLLNIDFTGGSSVTIVLNPEDEMPIGDVRDVLIETDLADQNLLVVQRGDEELRYTINTSEQSVDTVKQILVDGFPGQLQTFAVDILEIQSYGEGDLSGTEVVIAVNDGDQYSDDDGVGHDALLDRIKNAVETSNQPGILPTLTNDNYRSGSSARFQRWTVRLGGMDETTARSIVNQLKAEMEAMPMFPLSNKIGGRVSDNMRTDAMVAMFLSLVGIIGYLWLRFQKVKFGLAAVVALVHDVLIAVGALALSAYVVQAVPGLAENLKLDSFQISLPIVAGLLTVIGYSLNDTIVVFDRIREVRGKSPNITASMINKSINQTLSRTLLTSFTTFIVVAILYFFGGDGIHGFAFTLLIGIIVGTYSSIYIASPALLLMSSSGEEK